jgi:V/A-type H+/Na+-transporting ATPase subunit D
MPELERELSANRSTALELREERRLVQEGYEFLDEKRMLLAAEILRGLERYQLAHSAWLALHNRASAALVDAAARHGLDGLIVHPASRLEDFRIAQHTRRAMGIGIVDAQAHAAPASPVLPPVDPSPEARACGASHLDLLREAVPLAALERNLRRLTAEYRRTERRARALENVLMPELEQALRFVEEQLELYELEENVRVHEARPGGQTLL